MAYVCPAMGCKHNPGLCIHEKILLAIVAFILIVLMIFAFA